MKKLFNLFVLKMVVVIAVAIIGAGSEAASQDYSEEPIILDAKRVLPQNLLRGKNYRVNDKVANDGILNIYTLATDYGPLRVEGTGTLLIRINELNALKAMEEMHLGEVAGDSAVEGVKAPFKGAVKLVKEPVKTSKGIVKGTGRFLSDVGRSVYSSDTYQENALEVAVGYGVAKRQYAYEFGIDANSDYEPVVDRLSHVAQATVGGGLAPRAVMAGFSEGIVVGMQVSATAEGMRKLVRDNSAGELEKINLKKLGQMGVDESLAEAFLANRRYTPQEETFLVGALATMRGVKDRSVFIKRVTLAQSKPLARHYRMFAEMMAAYHKKVAPAARVVDPSGSLGLLRKDGVIVFLAPIDYIFWTKNVEQKMNKLDRGISKVSDISAKEMWITGKIGSAAREHFTARGWKVQENAADILFK
jgi:hypothetical protein